MSLNEQEENDKSEIAGFLFCQDIREMDLCWQLATSLLRSERIDYCLVSKQEVIGSSF